VGAAQVEQRRSIRATIVEAKNKLKAVDDKLGLKNDQKARPSSSEKPKKKGSRQYQKRRGSARQPI